MSIIAIAVQRTGSIAPGPGRIRDFATGCEVIVNRVEVEVVDHRGRRVQPRICRPGGRMTALGAQQPAPSPAPSRCRAHPRPRTSGAGTPACVRHCARRAGTSRCRCRYGSAERLIASTNPRVIGAISADEGTLQPRILRRQSRRARRRLQHRHVDVQVQPVDAFERQRRVLRHDLGDGSCYLHGSESGRWASHRPVYGHRCLRTTRKAASRRSGRSGRSPADRQQTPRSACLVGLRRNLAELRQ